MALSHIFQVDAFEVTNAGVTFQACVKLVMPHIKSNHRSGISLQQTIGKSTGALPKIYAAFAIHNDLAVLKCAVKL